jgi:hypothetical protein
MAKITLDNLAHSYYPNATKEDDFALKELNHVWADGLVGLWQIYIAEYHFRPVTP